MSQITAVLTVLRDTCRAAPFCDLSVVKGLKDGSPIFITVHGTWKPDADWTKPESTFLKELEGKWPCAGIYRFIWSGVNGARARLVAAEVLSKRLTELAVRYSSSQIITISHSHGGNVVAWASTDATHPPTAAVYPNTPFIQVQNKSRNPLVSYEFFVWLSGLAPNTSWKGDRNVPGVADFKSSLGSA